VTLSRKRFVTVFMVLVAMFLISCPHGGRQASSPTPRSGRSPAPNILIVLTDDQRAGLELMPEVRSWFQEGGTTFRNAFATTPSCCPSRASIFTGLYAHNHGIKDNFHPQRLEQRRTVQFHLSRAGYRTGIAGKYFNRWPVSREPPFFNSWAIYPAPNDETYYSGGLWNVDGEVSRIRSYATTFIGRHAVRFLENSEGFDDQPWFLVVAPTAPHAPYTPERRYVGAPVGKWNPSPASLETDLSDKPSYVRDHRATLETARRVRAGQMRTLMSVDDLVGLLKLHLRDLGESRRTMALYLSDNGILWSEHSIYEKRVPYTPAIRVPFMMRWPLHVAEGTSDDRLVANIDIAPTILDAAGLPHTLDQLDGRSLFSSGSRKALLLEYWREPSKPFPSWVAVRGKTFQYVEYFTRDKPIARELYDLESDPWQLRNLLAPASARESSSQVARLHDWLEAQRRCRQTLCRRAEAVELTP
jgi:arylsulfatase A-like enzyme